MATEKEKKKSLPLVVYFLPPLGDLWPSYPIIPPFSFRGIMLSRERIKPRSPTLEADALTSEPPGKQGKGAALLFHNCF